MKQYQSYKTILGIISIVEEKGYITQIHFGEVIDEEYEEKETALIKKTYQEISEYLLGKRKEFDIPLNPQGTEFRKAVWEELKKIPYGEVTTYGEIAKRAGNPKAARAVGMANHNNPIAIIVPCHRVIGANGKLVGYAGGMDKKELLLKIEREH